MDRAVEDAGLDRVPGKRRPTLHDVRDTFASALIAEGLDVVQVSKQLGHGDPAITLRVYAGLFNRARGAERTTLAIDAAFGTALEPSGGDKRRTAERTEDRNTASLLVLATGGCGLVSLLSALAHDQGQLRRLEPLAEARPGLFLRRTPNRTRCDGHRSDRRAEQNSLLGCDRSAVVPEHWPRRYDCHHGVTVVPPHSSGSTSRTV
jgi:hypothetical protein